MLDNTEQFTHIELCAGYGGISLGLSRAIRGLRTIAYVEIEAFACANLVAKMEAQLMDVAPIWTNLKTFDFGAFQDRVDILSGGYPCQPFSVAGKGLGKEDPRHLWPWIADGVRAMRPRVCFFENVEGHINKGLREVISELEEIGYRVAWGIFSASEVGAPHQRKRVFILAISEDFRCGGGPNQDRDDGKRLSQRPSEVKSMVRGEAERCGGDSREELADSSDLRWRGRDKHQSGEREVQAERSSTNRRGEEELEHASGDGSPACEINGGAKAPSDREPEGENESSDTQGAGRPESLRDLREGEELADSLREGLQGQPGHGAGGAEPGREQENPGRSVTPGGLCGTAYPSRPGQPQYEWEPPRVVANTKSRDTGEPTKREGGEDTGRGSEEGLENTESLRREESGQESGCTPEPSSGGEIKSSMGGNADGTADWMDYAELYESCDNRTDELRMCGNGVMPDVAETAYRVLMEKLMERMEQDG